MTNQYKKFNTTIAITILIFVFASSTAQAGPAENAGRTIDEVAVKAGEGIRKGAEKTGEGIRKGVEYTGKALKKAGEKVQELTTGDQKGQE